MAKVYLSSTYRDLKECRSEVDKALRMLGHEVVGMEYMTASSRRPLSACLRDVERCQIYVGIFAWRYGFIPLEEENPERKSITELELRHARATGKECLIFLLHEDASWPRSFVDKGEQIERLREELQLGYTCSFFTNANDLATKVATAVTRALEGGAGGSASPRLGPVVHKECDRNVQEGEFSKFFSDGEAHRPDRPQFVVIHGDDGEEHDSLVERFLSTIIQPYAADKYGADRGAALLKKIPDWPLSGDLGWRRLRLFSRLLGEWGMKFRSKQAEDTAGEFGSLLSQSPTRVLALRHNLYFPRWDKTTVHLVRSYIEFWDQVGANRELPELVVFLNVIYQLAGRKGEGFSWGSLTRLQSYVTKKRIQNALRRVCGDAARAGGLHPARQSGDGAQEAAELCPYVMLTELSCVRQDDVLRWFTEHEIDDEAIGGFRKRETQRMFTAKGGEVLGCRSMCDIEPNLYRLVKRFEPEVESV